MLFFLGIEETNIPHTISTEPKEHMMPSSFDKFFMDCDLGTKNSLIRAIRVCDQYYYYIVFIFGLLLFYVSQVRFCFYFILHALIGVEKCVIKGVKLRQSAFLDKLSSLKVCFYPSSGDLSCNFAIENQETDTPSIWLMHIYY